MCLIVSRHFPQATGLYDCKDPGHANIGQKSPTGPLYPVPRNPRYAAGERGLSSSDVGLPSSSTDPTLILSTLRIELDLRDLVCDMALVLRRWFGVTTTFMSLASASTLRRVLASKKSSSPGMNQEDGPSRFRAWWQVPRPLTSLIFWHISRWKSETTVIDASRHGLLPSLGLDSLFHVLSTGCSQRMGPSTSNSRRSRTRKGARYRRRAVGIIGPMSRV